MAAIGMLLVGLGLVTAAAARTLTEIYLCYGVLIGLGIAFSYVPAVAAVQRWFVAWRGLASGIAAAGIGVGTALVAPAAEMLSKWVDWRGAFVVSGVAAAGLGLAGALMLATSPESRGLTPDGAPAAAAPPPTAGPELRAVLRAPAFWLLYVGTLLVSVPAALPIAYLVRTAQDSGMPHTEALTLLSVLGIGSIAGRLLLGAAADITGRSAMFIGCCAAVVLLTLLWAAALWAGAGGARQFVLFALGFGASQGGFVALLPSFTADHFTRRYAGSVIGLLFTGRALALLAAPLVALLLQITNGYMAGLCIAGVLGCCGTGLIACIREA